MSDEDQSLSLPSCRCLSRSQAAEYLGIGTTLLTRLGPPSVRLGRRAVYDRVDLDKWLDNYKSRGRVIKEELWPEKKDSTEGKTHRIGGSMLSSQTDAAYVTVLGLSLR